MTRGKGITASVEVVGLTSALKAFEASDQRVFRRMLGRFATGVTVLTVAEGRRVWAMTANAFTSVSLSPPTVLVCIDLRARTYAALQEGVCFGVNVLHLDQIELARRYADMTGEKDRFDDVDLSWASGGVPLLGGCLCSLACKVTDRVDAGDHGVFLSRVDAMYEAAAGNSRQPLIFYDAQFTRLGT